VVLIYTGAPQVSQRAQMTQRNFSSIQQVRMALEFHDGRNILDACFFHSFGLTAVSALIFLAGTY
jgi:hypothetical protein